MPPLIGDLPTADEDELRTKLAAAALSTVARQMIAALDADPDRLWQIVAAGLHGTADTTALLTAPLPVKATSKAVDLATTSQSEADEKLGRKIREQNECIGKEQRRAERKERQPDFSHCYD